MEKICQKCFKEKPISDFYEHCQMKDGRLSFCKECVRGRVKDKYFLNHDDSKERNRERNRKRYCLDSYKAYRKQWGQENKEKIIESNKRWYLKNKNKKRANNIVRKAIFDGFLKRLPCSVCGNSKSQAHHTDYSKPLDVVWLCHNHHREAHRV